METAADKISALAWRAAIRDRNAKGDDPTVVRHLHDLAALAPQVIKNPEFPPLARRILETDAKRSRKAGATGLNLLKSMVPTIKGDAIWREEYEQFVSAVSFGSDEERITCDDAISACERLVKRICRAMR